jgi:ComF family protein
MMSRTLQVIATRLVPQGRVLVQAFTQSIAPPVCVLCGAPGQAGNEPWGLDLCRHCEAACPRPSTTSCVGEQPSSASGCNAICVLFQYRPPVDRLITQLKFNLDPVPARVLAMLFTRELQDARPQFIVPMPLHPLRLRERGFNQCAEIARHLAPRVKVPVAPHLLLRRRHTLAQSGLSAAQRRVNVLGAFAVHARQPLPQHVALLDDVMTTGSTLAAAAQALKAAGVQRVDAWILARAIRGDADVNPGGQDSSSGSA